MKKRLLVLLVVLLSVVALMTGALTFAGATEAPAASINYFTLSMENAVYIQYAVDYSGFTPDTGNIGMLFWTAEPADPVKGTEETTASVVGTEPIEGKNLYIFKYTELSARQMCDTVWARAYALVDGTYYYSDVESYSVVTYAAHKLGLVEGVEGTQDESLKILLRQMLAYGEAAQKHFGYHPEVLPTDILPENRFTVTFNTVGGSEIPAQTVCRDRRVTEPEAPTKDGYTFIGWFNGEMAWNFETDAVTENITLTARWQESVRYSEGLKYTSDKDGTCRVTGIGTCTDTDIIIPSVYNGDIVTSIGLHAFYNCSSLTSVTIPDSVTIICSDAFFGCSSLTSVTIGNGVTIIGDYAFFECSNLTSINIPDSVTGIGGYAFQNCSNLTSVTIGNSVTSIGEATFYYCNRLTSITIPDSVTSIGKGAFSGCTGLTSIIVENGNPTYHSGGNCLIETASKVLIAGCQTSVIPTDGSVTSIGNYAFIGCSSLTSITIPDSVTSIGNSAFYQCSNLTSVTIPDSVTSIGSYAFTNCSNLRSITIPDSVTSIEEATFSYCSGLTSITIPDSVTSIGSYAFTNCSNLTSIVFQGTQEQWESISKGSDWNSGTGNYTVTCTEAPAPEPAYSEGLKYTSNNDGTCSVTGIGTCTDTDIIIPSVYNGESVTSIGNKAFLSCSNLTSVTIGNSVTFIGIRAFKSCSSLTSINISDSVTSIGDYAFSECSNLTSINIPDSVTGIGGYAFQNCSNLTSVTIPDSVTSIGSYAFSGCNKLMSVTIGKSVTLIGGGAFDGCWKLVEVYNLSSRNITKGSTGNGYVGKYALVVHTFADEASNLFTDENGYIFYEDGDTCYLIGYAGKDTALTLPANCNGKNYGIIQYAFYNCSSLTSVTIGNSVTSIGNSAFNNCSNLTSVTIGNSVTSIGGYAFANCSSLTSVAIGNSVTSIGDNVFDFCANLSSITVESGNPVYHSGGNCLIETASKVLIAGCQTSVIPTDGSVTSIGDNAFWNCSGLTSINIPDSVTSIGYRAFFNCRSLTSVTIGNSVTSIGNSAFSICSNLTSITIPDSVTSIGFSAFNGCSSLTSVTIGNSVTNIGKNAFYGCKSLTKVTFENTSAWWVSTSSTATSGTSISSTDLANPVRAATYLKSTYVSYYWKRS